MPAGVDFKRLRKMAESEGLFSAIHSRGFMSWLPKAATASEHK